MANVSILERLYYGLFRKFASFWVRPAVLPDPPDFKLEPGQQLCFVLESGGLADLLALQIICQQHSLPLPLPSTSARLWRQGSANQGLGAVVSIRRRQGLFFRRARPQLKRMQSLLEAADEEQLVFLPVGIYWGRSPDKERSVFKLLFSENWEVAGRSRKLLTTLFHGRHTLVQFSEPLALQSAAAGLNHELQARKVSRLLRVHFRHRRIASLGPDLSHKRTIVRNVLRNPAVVKAIENEQAAIDNSPGKQAWWKGPPARADEKARRYVYEIAANMSFVTVRFMQRLLQALWNRLYDGVRFDGVERLRAVSDGRELVYVPCHRSHIDYLLLSYALFMQGFSLPHIAAGLNLNVPVLGPFLRTGGAFFLRRRFAGNRLYAAVFSAYVQEIIARGHSMEYFIEGGRSRSGRLLPPKGGMLAMTVHAYLQDSERPIVFVPVYFGYERLVEGQSFISELAGGTKEKESLLGFFRSLRSLRQQFGEVYTNIGAPIALDDVLDRQASDWRSSYNATTTDERPDWLPTVVDELGNTIMRGINRAAAVTPVSLLSVALLSTPRLNLAYDDLVAQLELLLLILRKLPYAEETSTPEHSAESIIEHGARLGYIALEEHPLGDIVLVKQDQALAMTYFRNNILHLFAMPAAVAGCFINQPQMSSERIVQLAEISYPYLQSELFLRWEDWELGELVANILQLFVRSGLLEKQGELFSRLRSSDQAIVQLNLLAQCIMPALQRYYIATIILGRRGSGTLDQSQLEKLCELCAERLSITHGLRSPDFFERKLFRGFIQTLKQRGLLRDDPSGRLRFEADLELVDRQASILLEEPIRHSINRITQHSGTISS